MYMYETYTDFLNLYLVLKDGIVGPDKVYFNKTPLQYALQRRRYDIAHILIENGAAIDGITPEGHTILWLASNEGHSKDVEFLLNQGPEYGGEYWVVGHPFLAL